MKSYPTFLSLIYFIRRFGMKCIINIACLFLIWGIMADRSTAGKPASDPTTPPAEKPIGLIMDIQRLQNGPIFGLTQEGIYSISQNNPTQWKAQALLPHKSLLSIVGGSENRIFLLGSTSIASSGNNQLLSYEANKGIKPILEIPQGWCAFCSDKIGSYAKGPNLIITIDGGKSWLPNVIPFSDGSNIECGLWLTPDKLIIGGALGNISMLSLIEGKIKPLWHIHVRVPIAQFAAIPKSKSVLAYSDNILMLDLANGQTQASWPVEQYTDSIIISNGELYTRSPIGLTLQSLSEHVLGDAIKIECNEPMATLPFGKEQILIVQNDGRCFALDKKTSHRTEQVLNCDNTLIKQAITTAADPILASDAEAQEMLKLGWQLSLFDQDAIGKEVQAMHPKNNKEEIQLYIEKMKQRIAEKATTPPKSK